MNADAGRTNAQPPEGTRAAAETAVYDLLNRLGIACARVGHDPVETIGDCARIEEMLGAPIWKNLFLRNAQKSRFYLLLMPGGKAFRTKDLSAQMGISRLSFAEPEFMEELLGLSPGAVSVLGLMNDSGRRVKLLLDRDITASEWLGCHPCVNTATLRLSTADVFNKFLPYTGHVPAWVTL